MKVEVVIDKDTGKLRHFRHEGEVVPLESLKDFIVAAFVAGAVGDSIEVNETKESV